MSQNDFSIANQTSSNFRADLNGALQALASLSSGSTAPSATYANMLWYDTSNNILKMRAAADDTWINVAYVDQTNDAYKIIDNTQVVNTSGSQTGLIGDQSELTWEGGTSTTESLVSPTKIKAAIEANSGWNDSTPQATTSGSSFDFTGIPSGVRDIEIIFDDVSLSAGDQILVQIGGASGVSTSGYESAGSRPGATNQSSTAGFIVVVNNATLNFSGKVSLSKWPTSDVWVSSYVGGVYNDRTTSGGGRTNLGETLTRVRVTNTGGTFDNGGVFVRWMKG